jgi:uncharacterized membrane protein
MDWLVPWSAAHPSIVHFPIALLMVAPVFVVTAIVVRPERTAFGLSAFILMVLGTVAAFVAVASGEASAGALAVSEATHELIEQHEERAELARTLFASLTLVYGVILLVPLFVRKWSASWPFRTLSTVFLLLYLVALAVLVSAAHRGGMLVHEHGVLAPQAGRQIEEPR